MNTLMVKVMGLCYDR